MNSLHSWAVTKAVTVITVFLLSMQDPTYRPVFAQVALLTVLTPVKTSKVLKDGSSEEVEVVERGKKHGGKAPPNAK